MEIVYAKTQEDINTFCAAAQQAPWLTLDTEFKRESTFYPELCLVQLALEETVLLIDVISYSFDLSPLFNVLQNPATTKVLHAPYEDLEIFWNLTGSTPKSLFDTQTAAMFCGFGDSVGYEPLVRSLCGKTLDKSAQRTDWSKRPLTEAQIQYAVEDVWSLRDVYTRLLSLLEKKGRLSWVLSEMQKFMDSEVFTLTPHDLVNRIKIHPSLVSANYACLLELATWRDQEARARNKPRSWVLSDSEIEVLLMRKPLNLERASKIKGLDRLIKTNDIEAILAILKKTLHISVTPPRASLGLPSPSQQLVLDALKLLLKIHSDRHGIVPRLIANKEDLHHLACGNIDPTLPVLTGWRSEVFGHHALSFLKGRSALSIYKGKLHVSEYKNEGESN